MTAMVGSSGRTGAMLSRVARDPSIATFTKLRAYLNLIASAEAGDFADLLERVIREVPDGLGGELLPPVIAKRWAEEDPEGALAALLARKPAVMVKYGGLVAEKLAEAGSTESWSALCDIDHVDLRSRMVTGFLTTLAKLDPDAALKLAADLDPIADKGLLSTFVHSLAQHAPLKALAFAEAGSPAVFFARANPSYSTGDGYVGSLELGRGALAPIMQVAHGWAQSDLAAALAWAEGLEEGRRKSAALSSALQGGVLQDAELAVAYASENLEGWQRQRVFELMMAWYDSGEFVSLDLRRQMAEGVPGVTQHKTEFVKMWLETDPADAAEWLAGRGPKEAHGLMRAAALNWGASDFANAAAGVSSIADPALKRTAVKAVAEWLGRDKSILKGKPLDEFEMDGDLRAAIEDHAKEASR